MLRAVVRVVASLAAARLASELYLRYCCARRRRGSRHRYIVAHRAGAGTAPENTLAAAELAIAEGAQWLQLDVMHTQDRVVVVFHDMPRERNLYKLTGVDKQIADLRFSQLPPLKAEIQPALVGDNARTIRPADFGADGQRICTLEEMLMAVGPQIGCLIEFWGEPSEALVADVARLVRRHGRVSRTAIGNPFSAQTAAFCDKVAPDIRRIYHARELARMFALYWLGAYPFLAHADAGRRLLNCPLITHRWGRMIARAQGRERPGLVARAALAALRAFTFAPQLFRFHADVLGQATFAWILNDPDSWDDGLALGAQGLMTDYVAACGRHLRAAAVESMSDRS